MAYLLQHLLAESAERFPDHVALRFEGQSMTYAQLEGRVNQVARTLQANGVRPGDRVGIYVHKSPASVLSIFGILKAGGVYVPIDPNAPPRRGAYITRNCDIHTLLTSTDQCGDLQGFFEQGTQIDKVILLDEREEIPDEFTQHVEVITWGSVSAEDAAPVSSADRIETDLAYILYTSGSTGDPKGVMISHRTIFTFINWCFDTFHISPDDRVTSHAPIHFDLSTFDLFVSIKAGATIVLVPEKLSVFPVRLVQLLQDEKITVTYLVPSILSMMVNYGKLRSHDLSRLRLILFAGEVFPIKYLRALVEMIPHAEYYNLYGPTETNVCTYYKVQPKDIEPSRNLPVPIGKACENMGVFAVDERGGLITDPGQEGELWVRGSGVAQGYWGDPAKTEKSFLYHPFQEFREFVYRTGDIVTLDEDRENWIYAGRRDHMVKSRGYRIELGEIETALYGHPDVKEAAVVAIPDDLVGNRIKAFAALNDGAIVSAKDLERHCRGRLPAYMVPEQIELMDALPKTSTGKINRTGLLSAESEPSEVKDGDRNPA